MTCTRALPLYAFLLLPAMSGAQQAGLPAAAVDTTLRFDVIARTWHWPFMAAHIGLSCDGRAVVAGTSSAPDSAAGGQQATCAGALITMRNSTLTLRGARGLVHVRVRRPRDARMRDSVADTAGQTRRIP